MGCGCPGSFSEGKSNKKHKETQDTAKGEKSDQTPWENNKEVQEAKIRLKRGLRTFKTKERIGARERSQSADNDFSYDYRQRIDTAQGETVDENKKKQPQLIETDCDYNIVIHPARSLDDLEYAKKYGTWDYGVLGRVEE